MPENTLDFEEMLELSKAVKEAADEVADYQLEHFELLTKAQRSELNELEFKVRDASRDLLNEATRIAWVEIEGALEQIERSTGTMRKTLRKITSFRRAISIAAGVLTLAAAIIKADPIAAGNSTAELLDLFNKFKKEDEDAKKAENDAVG